MSFELKKVKADSKADLYADLLSQAKGLLHDEHDRVANAANFSALLYHSLPDVNWVGFYFINKGMQGDELLVGPFQGKPACVHIALGKGVCGTAAKTRETQLVPDVNAFPGHIFCDGDSRSELVVPLIHEGEVLGVLDLDSPKLARFDKEDQAGLEALAKVFLDSLR
ncbi:MAG TPA: GAF domain-containing protein [Gammaproteobacteria bacterium]|jgi:GAF domain-containing protein|nr:GAF domain-containing protein [Gammaproteobacteria bacterium]